VSRQHLILLLFAVVTAGALAQAQLDPHPLGEEEYLGETDTLVQAFHIAAEHGDRDRVRDLIRRIRPSQWPVEYLEGILMEIELAHVRFQDIHQSWLLEIPVTTPIPFSAANQDLLAMVDERDYAPQIRSAARRTSGTPGSTGETLYQEIHAEAVLNSRGRTIVFEELERIHAISTPLSPVDRDLSGVYDWIALYERSTSRRRASAVMDALSAYLYADKLDPILKTRARNAYASDPGLANSYLLSAWATAHVALASERWLVALISGETLSPGIETINEYRRFLNLPMVLDADVERAKLRGELPDWAMAYGQRPLEAIRLLEAAYALEANRFAAFAPQFVPPELQLRFVGR
jgi:hypothetical protein